jgi:hypothetical protein
MNRAEVVRRVEEAARIAGPQMPAGIVFAAGWKTNGQAGFNPRGLVNHTTEDSGAIGWANLLPVLQNGWGSLSGNPLYNSATRHDTGRVVVLSSGVAWHAGAGGWRGLSGNASVWGHAEQRGRGQQLTDVQLEASRVWNRALVEVFRFPVDNVCEHSEWAPGRKADRLLRDGVRLSGPLWRRSLQAPPVEEADMPLTDADVSKVADAVRSRLLSGGLPATDVPYGLALSRAYRNAQAAHAALDTGRLKTVVREAVSEALRESPSRVDADAIVDRISERLAGR